MATTKRLIAIDDEALQAAQAELGTSTLKDTVNAALKRVADEREDVIEQRVKTLASIPLDDRRQAWR
jgi:Arc/MetJ family transcription regulator